MTPDGAAASGGFGPMEHRWSIPSLFLFLTLVAASQAADSKPPTAPPSPLAVSDGFTLSQEGAGGAIDQGQLVSGQPFRLVLRGRLSPGLLALGERLRVLMPHYHALSRMASPQDDDPAAPGFTRLRVAPKAVSLRLLHPVLAALQSHDTPAGFDIACEGPWPDSGAIEAVYGEGKGIATAPRIAVESGGPGYKPFECWRLLADGRRAQRLAELSPSIVAGEPLVLRLLGPASIRPGLPFELRAVAEDRDGNLAKGFNGAVEFSWIAGTLDLAPVSCPHTIPVTGGEPAPKGCASCSKASTAGLPAQIRSVAGLALATGLIAPRPGLLRASARAADLPISSASSNPMLVSASGPVILFGDLHVHTGQASPDAFGSLEEAYRRARDLYALDFTAVTDHDGDVSPEHWVRMRQAVRDFSRPGGFIPLLGFEWTPAFTWGHRTCLFPSDAGDVVLCGKPPGDTPETLHALLARHQGFAIPHFPSAEVSEHHRFDWSHWIPAGEPLVEIFSQWSPIKDRLMAQDVETNPQGAQRALTMGCRLGFVAGSDNHTAEPGRTGGLAAVEARSHDRASLVEALRQRSSWATSGPRIVIRFSAAGARAGAEASSTTGPVELHAQVHGTAPIESLEVVRGWEGAPLPLPSVHTLRSSVGPDLTLRWRDPAPLAAAFYYLRVTQADGGRAWSSPVWVKRAGAAAKPSIPRPQHWRTLTVPMQWEPVVAELPTPNRLEIESNEPRIVCRAILREPPARHGLLAAAYFNLRSSPLLLQAGRRYRLSLSVASAAPGIVSCLTLDDARVNPGFFASSLLPGFGWPQTIQREFLARPAAGAVRLYIGFPPVETEIRIDSIRLEQADD